MGFNLMPQWKKEKDVCMKGVVNIIRVVPNVRVLDYACTPIL